MTVPQPGSARTRLELQAGRRELQFSTSIRPPNPHTHTPNHTGQCMQSPGKLTHRSRKGGTGSPIPGRAEPDLPLTQSTPSDHTVRLATANQQPQSRPTPTSRPSSGLPSGSWTFPLADSRSPRIPRPERWAQPKANRGRKEVGAVGTAHASSSRATLRPGRHRRAPPKAARGLPWLPCRRRLAATTACTTASAPPRRSPAKAPPPFAA